MTEHELQDDEMNSGLSIAERDVFQARLAELEDTVPPRDVWRRIEFQARAEGLFKNRVAESTKWFAGTGIAAAVVLAVLNIPFANTVMDNGGGNISATPPVSAANDTTTPANLSALMVRSQQIERDLRALPGQPRLLRASTTATIEEIENRIATIDLWLSHPEVEMSPAQTEVYWRERVRLMNSLLSLRRAQAQRMAF